MINALETSGLAVGWPHRTLFADLDLALPGGELIAVLGANGIGKSTLLRTLAGLQPALTGTVSRAGGPRGTTAWVGATRARPLGMVVRELVSLGRQPHTGWAGRLAAADHLAVDQALAATGADHLAHRRVVELSDGELQRVTIARALAQETPILFLDEATAHLDVRGRAAIAECLRAQARRGRLVVVATHDLELALGVADRLLVLEPGRASFGLAEDLALSGALDRALGGGELLLDPVRGGFFAPGRNRGRIALVGGDPQNRAWTTRALARVGLNVHEAASLALVIENGAWILPGGARAESLAAVVRALGNLGADAEVEEP